MGTGLESLAIDRGLGKTVCSLCGTEPSGSPMVIYSGFPFSLCPDCASWEWGLCLHCGGARRHRATGTTGAVVRIVVGCQHCGQPEQRGHRYSDARRERILRTLAPRLHALRQRTALRLPDSSPIRALLNSWSELPWSI